MWSLLLLASTVWSFAHMPLGLFRSQQLKYPLLNNKIYSDRVLIRAHPFCAKRMHSFGSKDLVEANCFILCNQWFICLCCTSAPASEKKYVLGTRTEVRGHWIWSPSSTFPHQNRPTYYWLLIFHRKSTFSIENSRKQIMRNKCLSEWKQSYWNWKRKFYNVAIWLLK